MADKEITVSGLSKKAYFVVTFAKAKLFALEKPQLLSNKISSKPELGYFSNKNCSILSLLPLSILIILTF